MAFRLLNEVRWLSRYFAVNALYRNYSVLTDYCRQVVNENNDPVNRYCLKRLNDPQYHNAIAVLNDVLCELANLSKALQKSCLTMVEAHQLVKARIAKLRSKYLGSSICWTDDVRELLLSHSDVNTAAICLLLNE